MEEFIVPIGDSSILTKREGGEDFEKALGAPVLNTDDFTPKEGRMRQNPVTGLFEVHDGTTWKAYAQVGGIKKLTPDFKIAVSNTNFPELERYADEIRYFTDSERKLRLNDYLPEPYKLIAANDESIQDVILDDFGDLIFMAKNNPGTTLGSNILFVRFKDCYLVNNVLTWEQTIYAHINNAPKRIHSLRYDKGFLFGSTRNDPADYTTIDTRLFRINAHDFSDVKIIDVPHATYPMIVNRINVYKGDLYFTGWTTSNRQYIMKAAGDLSTVTQLALTPLNTLSAPTGVASVVYRDYIYIPYSVSNVSQGFQKNGGIAQYDLYGNFVRSALFKDLPTANGTLGVHWMTVYNDRIVMTPSGQVSGDRTIYRVKLSDLTLEESKQMDVCATNNNTITSDGYLIYNEELAGGTVNTRIIKYNNFSDDTILFSSFSSSGSLDPSQYDDALDPSVSNLITGLAKTYANLITDVTDSSTLTGTTTETVLKTYAVPANQTAVGILDLMAYCAATGTAGIKTLKVYRNTTNNFGTATLIATLNIANTIAISPVERKFMIKSGNTLYGLTSGFNAAAPGASGASGLSISYNPADAQYIFVTGQLANTADSMTLKGFELNFKRQS